MCQAASVCLAEMTFSPVLHKANQPGRLMADAMNRGSKLDFGAKKVRAARCITCCTLAGLMSRADPALHRNISVRLNGIPALEMKCHEQCLPSYKIKSLI